jgi:hypothetical protein
VRLQLPPAPPVLRDRVISNSSLFESEVNGANPFPAANFRSARTELLSRLEKEAGLRRLFTNQDRKAERYKDTESEFDVLFTWEDQRFLGEAEGKDNKAINVDKISQLERNLSEDYAKENVQQYAKGMLFGNAFRLQKLTERGEFFTDKCISSAKRLKAALIRTPDLFFPARYVKASGDDDFARTYYPGGASFGSPERRGKLDCRLCRPCSPTPGQAQHRHRHELDSRRLRRDMPSAGAQCT